MKTTRLKICVATIALAAITVLLVGCGGTTAGPLKIGADLTFSGPTAYWSERIKLGLDLAVEQANAKGNERPIQIVYQDNQANPGQAVSIFQRLATVDNASVILSCFTPIGKPLRSIAAQNKTPLLVTANSAIDFGLENEWSFRDFPPQDQQGNIIADYSYNHLGVRRAGSLIVNDDFGRDGDKAFREEFAKLGGSIAPYETVEQKDTDVRSQVTKVMSGNPDVVFMVIRDNTLGMAVRQLREIGYKGKIVGVINFDTRDAWRAAGPAGEGTIFTSAYIDFVTDPAAATFREVFRTKYRGDEPEYLAVYGYTIGQYLADFLRQTGGDRAKMRQAISTLDRQSIRGRIRMSSKREVLGPIGIYEFKDGRNQIGRAH